MKDHSHRPEAIADRIAGDPTASYLRDWVYGGIDGSITTFAVVSGVVGANLSPTVILILGVSNLVADGFSMAASNYSATRTEKQELDTIRSVEERHIAQYPEGEREEVRQIYLKQGVTGADLDKMVDVVTSDRDRWIDFMIAEEYGVSRHVRSATKAAWSTFTAFLVCGVVPLIPFLFRLPDAFAWSLGTTLAVFFGIGSMKSRVLTISWWRGGLETLLTGSIAAAIAYGIGVLLSDVAR